MAKVVAFASLLAHAFMTNVCANVCTYILLALDFEGLVALQPFLFASIASGVVLSAVYGRQWPLGIVPPFHLH